MKKQILIIDGHNLLFKMYYGIPNSIKRNGTEIKGVVGFINTILKLYHQFNPYSILVIFDSETSTQENKKIINSYKDNRPNYNQTEDNPFTQLKLIKECLDYLKIFNIEVEKYEADDYIASICEKYQRIYSIVIVSTDKDFLQLINTNINVYSYNGKKSVLYNAEKVYEKYQILPSQFAFYLSLIGDKSDNIQGIKGVGPKTAIKKIKENDIEFYLTHKTIIKRNMRLILLNKKLNLNDMEIKETCLNNMNFNKVIEKILN